MGSRGLRKEWMNGKIGKENGRYLGKKVGNGRAVLLCGTRGL